jgi:anthranilate phosphoribosyltransferase
MKQILYKLFEHQYLGRDEARTILQNIAQGKYNDVQVASLITVFLMRNISVEELCGFRDALLEMRIPVDLSDFAPIAQFLSTAAIKFIFPPTFHSASLVSAVLFYPVFYPLIKYSSQAYTAIGIFLICGPVT